jgi:DNA-binding NtrC family response regulator
VILADGALIQPRHFSLTITPPQPVVTTPVETTPAPVDLAGSLAAITKRAVERAERQAIEHALAASSGDVARAAERLRVGFRALSTKMRALGIER